MVEAFVEVAAAGAGLGCVGVGGGFEEDGEENEEGIVDVTVVVGVGLLVGGSEDVSCAKEEVGRIHERKKRVEENGLLERGQWQIFLGRRDSIF
jgi:hypothetical protein